MQPGILSILRVFLRLLQDTAVSSYFHTLILCETNTAADCSDNQMTQSVAKEVCKFGFSTFYTSKIKCSFRAQTNWACSFTKWMIAHLGTQVYVLNV